LFTYINGGRPIGHPRAGNHCQARHHPEVEPTGTAIAICFAPEEDCATFAIRAINNAEREILVGAYALTTGSGIVEALVPRQGARR
jgi:hypothetical protein